MACGGKRKREDDDGLASPSRHRSCPARAGCRPEPEPPPPSVWMGVGDGRVVMPVVGEKARTTGGLGLRRMHVLAPPNPATDAAHQAGCHVPSSPRELRFRCFVSAPPLPIPGQSNALYATAVFALSTSPTYPPHPPPSQKVRPE